MNMLDEIRSGFRNADGLFRLLVLNISVFVILKVIKLAMFLSGSGMLSTFQLIDYVAASSYLPNLITSPWTLLTYMFVHEGFFHILFNMLILFWLGKIFCEYLGSRRIVPVYILGGLAGAFLYILAYNLFPAFSETVVYSRLIGASAGVIAVMVAIATLIPNYSIQLLFFGAVKLKYVALVSILLYVISIPDGNAGGNISHLGGAMLGYVYTRMLQKGTNIGSWIERLADMIMNRPRMKVVKNRPSGDSFGGGTMKQREMAIDEILDKISRSGYSSLSAEEKEILFKASKRKGPKE